MNREQAQHILDAYVEMECAGGDNKARQSLREVILDAMTGYRVNTTPSITWPNTYPITVPNVTQPTPNYVKPIVTCGVGE